MKLLRVIRIILAVVLVFGTVPLLVTAFCIGADEVSITDFLSLWKEFGFIAAYFVLSWYESRLRKQRGLPSFYDKFDIKGLAMLKWICLGASLFTAFWVLLGADFLRTSNLGGQMLDDIFVTESDAEGYLFFGLFVTYPAAAALSALIPLFVGASIHLHKRKRTLRQSGPDA